MDEGFKHAGFEVVWANENHAPTVRALQVNNPSLEISSASISELGATEVPKVDGFIGGPPCQSWSVAGANKGDGDPRGRTLWDYVRVIEEGFPPFFVLENVPGMLAPNHRHSFVRLLGRLTGAGYNVSYGLLNSRDYLVPQERKRLFIVGYRIDAEDFFSVPPIADRVVSIADALSGIDPETAVPLKTSDRGFAETEPLQGHHFLDQEHYSYIFMSRNRVRPPSSVAFTVQASGNHAQLHPKAPPMEWVEENVYRFAAGQEHLYRRISVRESARIQTFSDDFLVSFDKITDGYRMVGNAVPVNLARAVAAQIRTDLGDIQFQGSPGKRFSGSIRRFDRDAGIKPLVYSA